MCIVCQRLRSIHKVLILTCYTRRLSLGACNYPTFLSRRFTNRANFSLNLSRIQIPTGTSVTNWSHKLGLMSTSRHDVDMFTCFILTEACTCRLELAYFAGIISKNRLVCKNAFALAYYESCTLLVMGSWLYPFYGSPYH